MAFEQVKWIESGGGPLLFACRASLRYWSGASAIGTTGVADYNRACAVRDEIDVIDINVAQALVLGDEPDRTALVALSPTSVMMLRWRAAESESALLSALNSVEIDQLPTTGSGGWFKAVAGEYLLFDSAWGGNEVVDALRIEMLGGVYRFDTVNFKPNRFTHALVHRLILHQN